MANAKVETKTYLVERNNETLMVTVPADWKVTFGPIFTPTKGYGGPENCLRFYEAKDRQRAIFTGVRGFRDTSIPVQKKVVAVKGKTEFAKDHKGEKHSAESQKDEKWVSADEVTF
jgi:hypothetical protein